MASTSLAELYFRSLKRIKVLSLLTKYLLQYNKLCIPHVGTFEMVQHSPEFNVVDQQILPPSFHLHLHHNELVPEHQVEYVAVSLQKDKERVREELDSFGQKFKKRIQKHPFQWNGFGTLSTVADSLTFNAEPLAVSGFDSVPALKVIRENVEHRMLVGDQQMTSQQVATTLHPQDKKRSYAMLIGWILLGLTIVAIVFILYKSGFNPLSSGLRSSVSN